MSRDSTPSWLFTNDTFNFTYYYEGDVDEWLYLNLYGIGYWSTVLCIVIIGTIGNILQFIMMTEPKLTSLSYSVYLKFLAFSDSLHLGGVLIDETAYQFSIPPLIGINNALCKIVSSARSSTTMLSPWLVVGLTLDRFVCVCFPLTRGRFCTRKKAIGVCSSLVAASIMLILPALVLLKLDEYGVCRLSEELNYYFIFICLVISSALPCVVILVLNITIIIHIHRSKQFRNMFVRATDDSAKDRSTRPLVLISVLAFVTLFPNAIAQSVTAVLELLDTNVKVQILTYRLMPLFTVIYLLNFGQNFFILIGSSQNYRRIMKRKLRFFWVNCGESLGNE